MIKPHVVKVGQLGKAITQIEKQFPISSLEMFYLDHPCAEEFLEIYKNLIPEYVEMVNELSMGPCVALEIWYDFYLAKKTQ